MTREVRDWSIVTPEYPPGSGGVGDYVALVAGRLAEAGERVVVWTPSGDATAETDPGVRVRRLPDNFGPRSMKALSDDWRNAAKDSVVLVQYVPHGFGWKGMNLPFATWLGLRAERLWLMVHEPLYPFMAGQPLRHDVLSTVTWLMLRLAARRAERVFVSTPAWESFLPRAVRHIAPSEWLPIPATVTPDQAFGSVPESQRPTVAHFGTYGEHLTPPLLEISGALLDRRPDLELRFVGRGSDAFRGSVLRTRETDARRVHATGPATPHEVLRELASAWAVIFPFVEGATARRTSLMSALAAGAAIVTTEGWCSESVWRESRALELVPIGRPEAAVEAVLRLLADERRRAELRRGALDLYAERFELHHVVDRLLALRAAPTPGQLL